MFPTLSLLREVRKPLGVTSPGLALVTGIRQPRLAELETATTAKRKEPWLDEAARISYALCLPGIVPLMGPGAMTVNDCGAYSRDDLDLLRSGLRVPLGVACRIAKHVGMTDPRQLFIADNYMAQVWDVLEQNERGAAAGTCPWCFGTGGHTDSCVPTTLWSRNAVSPHSLAVIPKIERMTRHKSGMAHGLQYVRERVLQVTQAAMAAAIDRSTNTIARAERLEMGLTHKNAAAISKHYQIDVEALYAKAPEA